MTKKIFLALLLSVLMMNGYSQTKTVVLDVSHETDSTYKHSNPNIFKQYKDIVENGIGANLIINHYMELNGDMLRKADVLIILSPLDRNRKTPKNDLTTLERESVVNYVKNGGKLIIFMDEEHRVDMEKFGGNDILKPFGMEYGLDLPMKSNIGATSVVLEIVGEMYELSYSGSRSLSGGTPISYRNGEDKQVHGAYVKLENGGAIAAFGETMTGLFMGGITMTLTSGMTITWRGKDDQTFIKELIKGMLR